MSSDSSTQATTPCADGPLLARHPTFWYEDGSVILNVETTSFRVHRSILCSYSTVFSDMFSLPHSSEEVQDDCPVVDLPDQVDDFVCLMQMLYQPFAIPVNPARRECTDLTFICRVLRLSTKYIMCVIRQWAIQQMERYFATSLPAYRDPSKRERLKCKDLVRVINVARETGVPWVLPVAFYQFAEKTCVFSWLGVRRSANTWPRLGCFASRYPNIAWSRRMWTPSR